MSTWEQRMSARAAERSRFAEAEERAVQQPAVRTSSDWHLHGTLTVCPCGAETGITTVAFPEDWVQPDPCETCGKPVADFGNTYPWRHVDAHVIGCREHPETVRCVACGDVMIGTVVWSGKGGPYHFREGCCPGARTVG